MRSRNNAIRHGVFAAEVVLPGEDPEAHRELLRDAIDALRPQDALQMCVVERVVAAEWRLRRLREAHRWLHEGRYTVLRAEMLACADDPASRDAAEQRLAGLPAAVITALLLQDEDQALERLGKHEQRLELSMQRSLRQLRELQNPKIAHPEASPFEFDAADASPPPRWPVEESPDESPVEESPAPADDATCENEPTEARVSRNIAFAPAPAHVPPPRATEIDPDPPR